MSLTEQDSIHQMFGYLLYSSHSSAFSPLFSALYTERETGMLIHKYTFVVLISHINQQLVASERGGNIFHDPCPKLMPFQRLPRWNEFLPVFPVLGTRIRNSAKKATQYFPTTCIWPFSNALQKSLLAFHIFYPFQWYCQRERRKFLRLLFRNNQILWGFLRLFC